MNRRLIAAAGVAVLTIALGMNTLAQNQDETSQSQAEGCRRNGLRTVAYDVACDARTFRLNNSGTLLDARRGDGFIVQGKIYPAGTIPPGGTMQNPGLFNLDTTPGSIGTNLVIFGHLTLPKTAHCRPEKGWSGCNRPISKCVERRTGA